MLTQLLIFKNKVMKFKHYVGVDVSKSTLDFAVCLEGKIISRHHGENSRKGID